jgi:hypothetical protein
MIMSEKKTPIESAEPELKNVPRIPAAAPRWLAGTEPMTDDVLGEEKMPEPRPLKPINAAKSQYGKSTGRSTSPTNEAATSTWPPTANRRVPYRSESQPEAGPATRKPTVSGSR